MIEARAENVRVCDKQAAFWARQLRSRQPKAAHSLTHPENSEYRLIECATSSIRRSGLRSPKLAAGPQVRGRDGEALPYQPAYRFEDRRGTPSECRTEPTLAPDSVGRGRRGGSRDHLQRRQPVRGRSAGPEDRTHLFDLSVVQLTNVALPWTWPLRGTWVAAVGVTMPSDIRWSAWRAMLENPRPVQIKTAID